MGHVQIGKVPYHRIWISPQACKTATIQSQFKIMPSFWQLIQLITENYSQSQIAEGGVHYAIQGGEKPRITNAKLHNKSLVSLTIWIIIFLKFNRHARHVILKSKHRSTKKPQCWEANEGGRRLCSIFTYHIAVWLVSEAWSHTISDPLNSSLTLQKFLPTLKKSFLQQKDQVNSLLFLQQSLT